MTRRRGILALLLASALLVVTACSGLPTSGTVNPGLPPGDDPDLPDTSFIPNGPQEGASPQQIVDGFIAAGTSPAGGWEIAKLFLVPDSEWNPNAGVTIDEFADRRLEQTSDDDITLTITPTATVDAAGTYTLAEGGAIPLPFVLAVQPDGEWRITSAPDGIVLDRRDFPEVFHPYSLMYFDPSWRYLVPDMRWFPARGNAAYRIAQGLLDGEPSAWLADSVKSAFTDDVSLVGQSVPIASGGVAQVELGASALGLDAATTSRMQAQLEASLSSAGATTVEMTAAGDPIVTPAAQTRSTRVDSRALVQTADEFGFLSGDAVDPIPGLSESMRQVSPAAVQVSADRDFAAVRVVGGQVYRVRSDGVFTEIDARSGLIAPTADPNGYIWSVPSAQPTELVAIDVDGNSVLVADAWTGASRIGAMQLSRDGARVAALVDVGGEQALYVAGVVRDGDGVPVRLGDAVRLATLAEAGIDVGWIDDTTLGVIAREGESTIFLAQPVGGEGARSSAPQDATSLAGVHQVDAVRLHGADGALYTRRGSTWQSTASGVLVLATQQGMPR